MLQEGAKSESKDSGPLKLTNRTNLGFSVINESKFKLHLDYID